MNILTHLLEPSLRSNFLQFLSLLSSPLCNARKLLFGLLFCYWDGVRELNNDFVGLEVKRVFEGANKFGIIRSELAFVLQKPLLEYVKCSFQRLLELLGEDVRQYVQL